MTNDITNFFRIKTNEKFKMLGGPLNMFETTDIYEKLDENLFKNASEKPVSIERMRVLPERSSSLTRSKISTLASTAMPIERMKPAMPGNDSVTGIRA